jgi:ferric-dicitrate binding protein FerR (iron transport regulator)
MDRAYISKLIEKYINNLATDAEIDELLSWYRQYDNDELLFPYYSGDEENLAKERLLQSIKDKIVIVEKPRPRIHSLYYQIAAVAILLLVLGITFGKFYFNKSKNLDYVSTKAGQQKVIKLSDGSVVWLSAKSSVRFPSSFGGPTREIALEGEAFFNIAKDKKHPFIVHTGMLSTRVLGTTFNIDAYEEHKNTVIALITGKVAFSDGKSQLKLTPGFQVEYNKQIGTTQVTRIPDITSVTGRRNGYYEYKNLSVAEVIEDVNRNFAANVKVEGKVKDCLFYGRINSGESLQKFLQKMANVVSASVIQTNNGYIIKGGGCI